MSVHAWSAPDLREQVLGAARRARVAARALAALPTVAKDHALRVAAGAIVAQTDQILAANREDLRTAQVTGTPAAILDRLALNPQRVDAIAAGLRQVAGLPDPVGEVLRGYTLPNGLALRQQRVPLGVIGIVYEGRPNVTVDAFGLALKSGNAALLRGSASAVNSNHVLVDVLRAALASEDLPADAVQLVSPADRSTVTHLIQARGLVDVVIPRGGAGLIDAVVRDAHVPTIETGVGNCHVYVHDAADLGMAERILLNSKTRRPSVCNAAETLLVDSAIADEAMPRLINALEDAGVTVNLDPDEAHLRREYLAMEIAVAVVDGVDAAIAHINEYGTGHTEAIVTSNMAAAQRFTEGIDAAAVMVNASTSFTDGEQFGFGAEIGISTQKLHARGPMGLAELTSTKWIGWETARSARSETTEEPDIAEEEGQKVSVPARPAPLFADIDDVGRRLAETGYLPDTATATAVFLADRLRKPLLVEGPAGVGKTELARAVAQATGSGLVRLQCYEGVDEARALYEWNHAKQILHIQAGNAAGQADWDQTKTDVFTEEFLLSRPLLTAIRRTEPTVLLIDETDKADIEIEGLLLEVLSDFAVTIPELGTITAERAPFVVLTSNATRELSEALKRRCLFLHIDFPDPELERRILLSRVPELPGHIAEELVRIIGVLRGMQLKKVPSVAETIDWGRTVLALGLDTIDDATIAATMGVVLKHQSDQQRATGELRLN